MEGWKYRSRELLKDIFLPPKTIREQTGSAWNFLQASIQVYRDVYIPYFKINACGFISFEECLSPQVMINKMVNEHTIDCHPSPSEFTSRIHPLIFLWTPKGFISPEYFLNFFSNLYIPPWLQESFKFMVLRLLENTFVSQKTEFVPQAKLSPRFLSSPLQAEGNYPFPPNKVFWKSIFHQQTGGGL